MFENMDKKYYINNFLASKGKPLHGGSTQVNSSLGIDIARDFAFNSPLRKPLRNKGYKS